MFKLSVRLTFFLRQTTRADPEGVWLRKVNCILSNESVMHIQSCKVMADTLLSELGQASCFTHTLEIK